MRQVVEIATHMLQARVAWLRARDDRERGGGPRLVAERYTEGVMDALAWVLHVDIDYMEVPKLASVVEPPTAVTITAVPAYGGYLVELPTNTDPGWRTEYFAYFISERQLTEMARAMVDLMPALRGAPAAEREPETAGTSRAAAVEAVCAAEAEAEAGMRPILLLRQRPTAHELADVEPEEYGSIGQAASDVGGR